MTLEDDLEQQPKSAAELRERASNAPNSEEIELMDVFDDEFVRQNTEFETFDEMVSASPSPASTSAELELVPDGTWDEFVAEHTVFDDEEELVMAARDHWVAARLHVDPK